MTGRPRATRPRPPTTGVEVLRKVDSHGAVSFAGTGYRVGNRYRGQTVGVRIVGDTIQITQDGNLLRTHRARHDPGKEFGALSRPRGKPRKSPECRIGTEAKTRHGYRDCTALVRAISGSRSSRRSPRSSHLRPHRRSTRWRLEAPRFWPGASWVYHLSRRAS
jgi:hypothetical protein